MNRTAIKNFAVWARKSLRDEVATNAARLGITRTRVTEPQPVAGGMVIGAATFDQPTTRLYRALRDDLNVRLRSKPLELVVDELVDEMAYTWFNRLAALRFMEVKGYIGRALSSSVPGTVEPDLLRDALSLADTLPGLDMERIDALQIEGDEPLYRALLVAQCKDLAKALPDLFGRTAYAELFLPARLLTQGSFIQRLVQNIPVEDWQDIEIVGWLYQFYISERKDEVFALKKAYEARDIPAATQLFTPHWIVRYMVENSLGRLWLEAHPESNLKAQMPYYLESKGAEKPPPNPALKPEDLTVMDPACGSGHILVYAFDLLLAIYQEQGYSESTIPELILTHNLHGLDIDERAAQLASFALMMKARERSRRVLRNPPALHVTHTVPTKGWTLPNVPELQGGDWQPLLDAFKDADNLGSLISPPGVDEDRLEAQLRVYEASGRLEASAYSPQLRQVVKQVRLLRRQYRAVVANPPYMGTSRFNITIKRFVLSRYPRSKNDMFAVFMERIAELVLPKGCAGMVTMHAWMFLSSYEELRREIIDNYDLQTMIHLGPRAFPEIGGEVVQTTAFTIAKQPPQRTSSTFVRLVDFDSSAKKDEALLSGSQRYVHDNQQDFEKIPGSPIAYWVSERVLEAYQSAKISDFASAKEGVGTREDDRFLRRFWEVNTQNMRVKENEDWKWIFVDKAGGFRRWYGLVNHVLLWENDGYAIRNNRNPNGTMKSFPRNTRFFFNPAVSWGKVGTGLATFRYREANSGFVDAAPSLFGDNLIGILSLLNSVVMQTLLEIQGGTLNLTLGIIEGLPIAGSTIPLQINENALQAIKLCKADWDSFETSWDFETHPLLRTSYPRLADAFTNWQQVADTAFVELKRLEEENNRYWIAAYGLQDELTPEVPDEQITIRRADLTRDIKSLISYAVGCMMGRYSLSQPGLQFAGGTFDLSRFSSDFLPDPDGILPITDAAYFGDDIVTRFEAFLRAAYGAENLQANLVFIADALTRRSDETPRERLRRYFLDEFISDHIQTYKKRPIYWLFTSGREKGFGALVYLHRYTTDTLATMRNDYVLELQGKLAAELDRVERSREGASTRDAKLAERRLIKLRAQQTEVVGFQERLQTLADQHIELDLDDGVAYNYTRFQGLLYEGLDLKMADLIKKSAWKRELLVQTS